MSSGITFIILLQAELLLMAIAAAIYFYLRYRKITLSGSEEAAVNSVPIPSPPSPTSKELLQSKIRQTRQRLAEMEGDETIGNEIKQCLQTRINLLELEME